MPIFDCRSRFQTGFSLNVLYLPILIVFCIARQYFGQLCTVNSSIRLKTVIAYIHLGLQIIAENAANRSFKAVFLT